MRIAKPLVGAIWVSILCVFGAKAQNIDVNLNPAQTEIHFTLGATMHTVHGTFKLKSGSVQASAATGTAEGAIVIDATSGDTGNASRDRKMHADVLKSAEYPTIIFVPQKVEGHVSLDGPSQIQIQGTIQILGSQHAVTVPVETQIDHGQLKAKLEFTIPYVQWGLKDPSTFVLRVDKSVKMEAQVAGSVTTSNR
ncbi:MAG TPA: YceI family protein [Candidatus Acidoferrales bacterium]|nr:YceI family protein [Candidatus Acidoferrales bacterium]